MIVTEMFNSTASQPSGRVDWWLCLVLLTSVALLSDTSFTDNLTMSADYDGLLVSDSITYSLLFSNAEGLYTDFQSQILYVNSQLCKSWCHFPSARQIFSGDSTICSACFCDDLCAVYGDCCPDITLLNTSVSMPSHLPITWKESQTLFQEEELSTCEASYVKRKGTKTYPHYRMINYCPPNQTLGDHSWDPVTQETWNSGREDEGKKATWDEVEAKCTNKDQSTHWTVLRPVTSSNGLVFRNKYCAQCHGQLDQDLIPWNISVTCDTEELATITSVSDAYSAGLNESSSCMIHFMEKNMFVLRQCEPLSQPLVSTCSQTRAGKQYSLQVERACGLYTHITDNTYKNIFCFVCNSKKSPEEIRLWLDQKHGKQADVSRVSFYALLVYDQQTDDDVSSSSNNSSSKNVSSSQVQCERDTVLDPVTCECRPVKCGAQLHVKGKNCSSPFALSNLFGFRICVLLQLTSHVPISSYENIFYRLRGELINIDEDINLKSIKAVPRLACEDSTVLTLDVEVYVYPIELMTSERMAQVIVSSFQQFAQSSINMSVIFPAPQCLTEAKWLDSIPDHCSTKDASWALGVSNIDQTHFIKNLYSKTEYYNLHNTTFCAHVKLSEEEYRRYSVRLQEAGLSDNNITMDVVVENNQTFHLLCVDHYHNILTPGTCQTNTQEPRELVFHDTWTSLGLLSVICTCISLFSLLCVMVTYCLLRPLRSKMGTCTLSMACLLFLAQLLYEMGIEQYEVYELCLMLAVLIHFFWLSAIFMMSSCTLQLFYSLVYPLQTRAAFEGKTVLLLSLACSCGLSMIIISLVMLANQLIHGDLGYPHQYLCFIRRSLSRQLGFGLPVALAVGFNAIIFIITTIHIRRLPRVTSTNDNQVSMMACVRLSVITGLTWLSLFMLSVPGTRPWLEYVSVLLLGLQGLLLATTLLINKRVFTLCRHFCRQHNKGSTFTADDVVTDSAISCDRGIANT